VCLLRETPYSPVGVISGSSREVDENGTLLGYYAGSSGNFLPTFRDNLSVPSSTDALEDKTDIFSRNVGYYHYSLRNNPQDRSPQFGK
jgi:hypothetical protein